MNTREQFHRLMTFEPGQRSMKWEFGYWAAALRRWYREGLPETVGISRELDGGDGVRAEAIGWYDREWIQHDCDVHSYLGLDNAIRRITFNNLMQPKFETEVLEDHGDWQLVRGADGVTQRARTDRSSLPSFVGFPVATLDDWERLKSERLRPTLEGRLPANWPQLVAEYRQRDYPLAMGGSTGFFGTPRALLGPENLLMGFYDDPKLVHAIVDDLADFWIALYDQMFGIVGPCDLGLIWEDMSYKAGSMVSPVTFREFLTPAYRKLTGFLRDHGVKHVWVDTDGDCWQLIPLMVEGGVTGIYPMEVRAGMDILEVRKAYPRLQIMGGLDKTQVAVGPAAIDAELAKVPAMLAAGGYIPYLDHYVPPDVSFENFVYYRRRLAEMIGGE